MSIWAEVREQARLRHYSLCADATAIVPASELLMAAAQTTGIVSEACAASDALLDGAEAALDRELKKILYSNVTDPRLAAFHVAHEYAHFWLDEVLIKCDSSDLDLGTPAEPEMSLVGESDAYSPKERAEAQANLYAREFLLPREKLRALSSGGSFNAEEIAGVVGVPLDLVLQQLADALLLPEEPVEARSSEPEPEPDPTQVKAITAGRVPFRVGAGPGTGKTRTLVGRVKWLIQNGEDPSAILVLTFSNFAAQDLAKRIRAELREKAAGIWVGTFHAFGLELLRKHGSEIELPEPRLIDRSSSLDLLEQLAGQIGLDHYLDLYEPVAKLRTVFALISRAKDELVTPEQYHEAATRIDDETDRRAAIEVARAFKVYEAAKHAKGLVDFGDLIARPVELLRAKPDVRALVRAERKHVLVDEYQDMNRASGFFLRDLVEPGMGPWVVGDVKQAIYRFRGGSPLNMARFADDFPGASGTDLGVNYRSGGRIVRTFQTFERSMTTRVLGSAVKLEAQRGESIGSVELDIASTVEAECEGVAAKIRADVERGGSYGRHTILARSHGSLVRLARHLESSGIPCLYFGDFFERAEIREVLSLLSVVSEKQGLGMFRITQLPQYRIAIEDLQALSEWRRTNDVTMLAALGRLDEVPISTSARVSLERLKSDLGPVSFATRAHAFLLRFMFRDESFLKEIFEDRSVGGQQKRLAIYQLLQFAFAFRSGHKQDPKKALLEHIRRLEILDEEKQLRQLPAAAAGLDAVRMMTVHASKGLQFPIVHIPWLSARHFPYNREDPNTLPPGLVDEDALMSRAAEEESLFFVAISRAMNELHLSRAVAYGGGAWKSVGPSDFLVQIGNHLSRPPDGQPNWTKSRLSEPESVRFRPPSERDKWSVAELETYLSCPRRFYYEAVVNLDGGGRTTPYLDLHRTIRGTITWMQSTPSKADRDAGRAKQLEGDWANRRLIGHPMEEIYRAAAERIAENASDLITGTALPLDLELTVTVQGTDVIVTCRADHVGQLSTAIEVHRLKLTSLAKDESGKLRYFAIQEAVQRKYPGRKVEFHHVSLLTRDRRDSTASAKKLANETGKLGEAITGIREGRFHPVRSDRECPRCPFFFICPAHNPSSEGA
ncbi:MAG: UvrD-helicase domain-containing protein [Bryobacterales bacterium]|nr:UvrD-helicase domain-containing protein [Bryobacterales bacterium]